MESGTPEAIAFMLWDRLGDTKQTTDQRLDLFKQCLEAARGAGRYQIKTVTG